MRRKKISFCDLFNRHYLMVLFCLFTLQQQTNAITITETLKQSKSTRFTFGGSAFLTSGIKDSVGDGWLRLTKDSVWQTGYAILNQSFPSKLGILIDLEMMIWRTNTSIGGADGISVFLFDTKTPTFNIGAFGGSLGYAQYVKGIVNNPGVSNGFLGLGIDEFGNYSNPTEGRQGGPGPKANSVGLRGPASSQYAWITGNTSLPFKLQLGQLAKRPTDDVSYRRLQIEISPTTVGSSTTQYSVTARMKTSKTGDFQTIFAPYTLPYTTPDSLKLGLAASTGASLNFHDVRNLMITTPGGVRVAKSVDQTIVNVGGSLTYTVDLFNQAAFPISGLKFSDIFNEPSSFQIESITFDNQSNTANTASGYSIIDLSNVTVNLGAYSNCRFIIKGKVVKFPTSGYLLNTANLDLGTSGVTDPDLTNNTSFVSTQITSKIEKITLVKSISNSKQYQLGDVVKYSFAVGNPGEVNLNNVIVKDNKLSSNPVYASGDLNYNNILEPGESWIYSGNYTVKQADLDSGKIVNQALVISYDPFGIAVKDTSGVTATDNNPTTIRLTQNSKITLVKSISSSGSYTLGSTIRYSFAVNNAGNTTLSQVSITDSKLLTAPVYQSGDLNSNGKLDIGETWYFTGEYVITQTDINAQNITNTATVTSKDPLGNVVTDISGSSADNDNPTVTSLDQKGKIALIKMISNTGPFKLGDEIKYTFLVSNTGNVRLTNLSFTDAKLINPIVYSKGDSNNDGALDLNESWTYTSSYVVTQADVDSGYVSNKAIISALDPSLKQIQDISGPTALEDAPTITILPQTPKIALIKTVRNSGVFKLSDNIKYDFTVANTGNVTLKIDSLSDTKLLNRKGIYVSGDINGNSALDVGEIWVYTGTHKVVQADVDSGKVINTALIYALDPQGRAVRDSSGSTTINNYPTVTPIAQSGGIALVKTVTSNGSYLLGSTVNYIFIVINTGTVSLSEVKLNDSKLTGNITKLSIDANGKLDVGESWTYSGDYIVTQADVDAGYIANTATVRAKDPQGNDVNDISGSAINNNNPTVTIVSQSGKLTLVKKITNTGPFRIGSEIDYSFIVTNIGNVTLSQPVVSDARLNMAPIYISGDVNSNNKLDVGESWVYAGKYVVTHPDVIIGSITNSAIANAYDPLGTVVKDISGATASDDNPTVTPVDQAPTAYADQATTKANIDVIIPILNNDQPGGASIDPTTVQIISQPQHGTLVLKSDGTVTYTPNVDYTGTDQFTYTVKDVDGFTSNIATVDITIEPNQLFIPNVFTPNGDGKNDLFEILGLDSYSKAELAIFNRWGSEVYHSTSYHNDWDGAGLNDGTYYYVLKLVKRGNNSAYSGWVLLKR